MSKKSKKEETTLQIGETATVVLPAAEAAVTQQAKADKKAAKAGKKAAKAEKKAAKQLKKATREAKKAQKAAKGDKHKKKCKKSRVFGYPIRNLIVTAVVSLLLGAAFLVKPTMVYTYCGYGLGGLAALVGLIYIIMYFAHKPVSGEYHSEFAIGLVALLAGAYVAVGGLITGSSGTSITFATIVRILGVLMAADGIMKLQYTLDIARMKYPRWWIGLITTVLGIALGVVTVMGITYELGESMGLGGMMMLGIAIAVNGVLDLVAMIVVAVRNHKAEKAAVLAEAEAILAAKAAEKEAEAADDFFTTDDSSATEENAPAEEAAPASEGVLTPEPQIELVEEKPASGPAAEEPDPAPAPVPVAEPAPAAVEPAPAPAVEEPILPEPELATPTTAAEE